MVHINSFSPDQFEWNFRLIIFKLFFVIDDRNMPCEIPLRWRSLDLTEDKSTLVQVMAWCPQAASHYLSQCWPRSVASLGHNELRARLCLSQYWLNTLRPRQNGRHFPDDLFKCIFLNENVWISIKNSLKFVPKGPIDNIPALVQIMVWRRLGDKPLSEPMIVRLPTHICVTRPQWVNMCTPCSAKPLCYYLQWDHKEHICEQSSVIRWNLDILP